MPIRGDDPRAIIRVLFFVGNVVVVSEGNLWGEVADHVGRVGQRREIRADVVVPSAFESLL